jgi:hypothetical protein
MNIEKLKIGDIKLNKKNPRVIKDDKYQKLIQSIKDFPEMLEIRPIVIDEDNVVLGGNMRLKACKEAGLIEVPIIRFFSKDEKKKQEFLIKDNIHYGEWDWMLINETKSLDSWGMDTPEWILDEEEEDDFFSFMDEESGENLETKGEPETNESSMKNDISFMLLMLEKTDYEILKKSESTILKKMETENISDAFAKWLKNKN